MTPLIILLIILTALLGTSVILNFMYQKKLKYWTNEWRKWRKEKDKYPWPIAFHTVDIALWRPIFEDKEENPKIIGYEVCMGQKSDELGSGLYRFPGGFVDPTDQSAEAAALRELGEEVPKIDVDPNPQYITSMLTNDKRYRNSRDKILTSFYKIQFISGHIKPGDDLAAVEWIKVDENSFEKINPIHLALFISLIKSLNA